MEIVSEHFDIIQSRIKNCEYCNRMGSESALWVSGMRLELNHLFITNEISEDERKVIICRLKCPVCGNTNFDEFSFVGVDFSEADVYEKEAEDSSVIYGNQIQEFITFLRNWPSLGLKHPIGKNLFESIGKNSFSIGNIQGEFFRCRKHEGDRPLSQEQMNTPPLGVSGQGRYNYDGQNHLYISSALKTAASEVLQGSREDVLVWMQKFEVETPICNLLDLREVNVYSKNGLDLLSKALLYNGFLVSKEDEIGNWKPNYFLTRFMMDCAKFVNYSGIIYNSSFDLNNYNVVLFNGSEDYIKCKGEPEIYRPNKHSKLFNSSLPF